MEAIIIRLFEYNGSVLIIDYGYDGQSRDTFRVIFSAFNEKRIKH